MKKWGKALMCAILLGAVALTGCGSDKAAESTKTKVAFIHNGSINDGGWSNSHSDGRLQLLKDNKNVEATYVENVGDGADAERVITQLAAQGNKVIFAASFGYMDSVLNVAKKYPNVVFEHCSGYKSSENMGNYFGRMYEARYLTGIVAGLQTKTNKIGYVAAFPIPEVVRGINAFTLGVQSVNKDASVKVIWSNTWYDPAKEKQAGITLIDDGCDVITQHQDTVGPQIAAEERGVYSIGYHMDMSKAAPKAVLTSAVWHWGPFYEKTVKEVQDGTWKSNAYWGGIKEGIVDIAPYGPMVPDTTKKAVAEVKKAMLDGTFTPFEGPVLDQAGKVRVPKGEVLADKDLLSMNWFVQGVDGYIAK
jgi:basic membrane protein A